MVYYPNLLKNKQTSAGDESRKIKIKKILKISVIVFFVIVLASGGYLIYKTDYLIKKITGDDSSLLENIGHLLPFGNKDILQGEDDGRINVLLLGMRGADDPHGGLLADSIMIVSVKLSEQRCEAGISLECVGTSFVEKPEKIALISIPRDLFVEAPGYDELRKLNSLHLLGEKSGGGGGGLKLTKEVISNITGLPIHYGISIDFIGFKEIIDSLDGIEVDVPRDFHDPNYDGGIYVKAGRQEMNAETALKYAQARLTSSDFDRAKRQQFILVGIKEKAMSGSVLANPIKVLSILDSLGKHVKTDMEIWEVKRFTELSKDMNNEETTIHKVFDTGPEGLLYSTHVGEAYALRPVGDSFDQIRGVCEKIFEI